LQDRYELLARDRPGDPALAFARPPTEGTVLTWAQLWERADARAAELARAGVSPGRRCALLLADEPDQLPTLLAAWRLGATVVPLDPLWGDGLTRRVLEHSAADLVVPVSAEPTPVPARRDAPPLPPDAALLSYTSGSTADPKGVVLRHRQLLAAYDRAAAGLARLGVGVPGRFGCAMRLSGLGVLGMNYLWPAVMGAQVVVLPELSLVTARGYALGLAEHRIGLTYLVPPMVELVTRMAVLPDRPGRTVCLSGGAPLAPATQRRFQDRFGLPLLNAYGLTEVSFAAFLGDRDEDGFGTPSIGPPVTVEARLRGDDGTVPSGPDTGGLELAGPAASDGYYDNPAANAALWRDGWVVTGDVARCDAAGRYWLVGRVKDAVMKGAFTIYLSDVEEAAERLPGVLEAAAVRIDLPGGGEDIGLLVRTADSGAAPGTVQAALERSMGRQRGPRRVVDVPGPLPRVGQGKIDRRAAAALWRVLVGTGGGVG
jgi:acyl-CoA synthetase (AMP-forming)/AMP-acid ligase II